MGYNGSFGGGGLTPEQGQRLDEALARAQYRFYTPPANIVGYTNQLNGGDALQQGWTDPIQAAVALDTDINENVWFLNDASSGQPSQIRYPLGIDTWSGWSQYRATGALVLKVPTTSGTGSTAVWFGFSAATNTALQADGHGWPSVTRGAFRFYLQRTAGGTQQITISDGPSAGTYDLPEHESDNGYNTFALTKNPANGDQMVLIVNGVQLGLLEIYEHANNYADDRVVIGSGTSSGVGRQLYMRSFEFVIGLGPSVIEVTKEDIELGKLFFIQPGIENWTVRFPDEDVPSAAGIEIFTAAQGTITLEGQPTDEGILFDRQRSIVFESTNVAKEIKVTQNSIEPAVSILTSISGRQYNTQESGGALFRGTNLLSLNDNVTSTTVTGDPNAFITAFTNPTFSAPARGYATGFRPTANTLAEVRHAGTSATDYRIDFSGTVVATDPAFLDTYIGIQVVTDLGQTFTGGVKFYPVGVSFGGASPALGFSITVYGRFEPNEVVELQVSSNTAGDLVVTDVIVFTVGIQPTL